MAYFDPVEFIRTASPGAVIYGLSREPDVRIDFLVREESETIARIAEEPKLETRSGSMIQEGVLMNVVMFRFEPGGRIFETFWDYHRHAGNGSENNLFCHLSEEKFIHFNFFGESGEVEAVVDAEHRLQNYFLDAIQRAENMPAWDDEAFSEAKEVLIKSYPSAEGLWEALNPVKRQ